MSKERILLLVLTAALFTHIMDLMIIMPLGPQLMRLFDITPAQFSLLVSCYSFAAGGAGLLGMFVIDRFDRKQLLFFLYTGFTAGTLACAFAPTYEMLLITRSVAGAFGGVLGALILSIVSDAIPLERRAAAVGFVMAAFSVASVFGVPSGLYLASLFGWYAPFLFLGGLGIIIMVLIGRFVPAMTHHLKNTDASRHPAEIIRQLLGKRNPLTGLLFTAVLMFGHFSIIPFIAPYMVGNVGFTEQELTYIYLVGGSLTILSSPMVGKIADRYGKLKTFTVFGVLVLLPVAVITHLPPMPVWQALIVTGVFFVLANGRMVPSTTMVTAVINPANRGGFMSLRSGILQISSGLAAMLAGTIITETPSVVTAGAKALEGYEKVGYVSLFFGVAAVVVAQQLRADKDS